ncbi:MAG: FAD-binding oxidoreductase [Acidobacteria bacterium]|nr:FAD-binding oxidoreductase [Acidobacteriota bacterium]MBI3655996.1 FAD-binding oxidoreductase [Acidobacteriota bacterium]
MKWWGWGAEDITFALEGRTELLNLLEECIGPVGTEKTPPIPLDQIRLPEPATPDDLPSKFESLLGAAQISTDRLVRLKHSLGRSYTDLLRLRQGQIDRAPDLVLFPRSPTDIETALRLATENHVSVVPFGGGTSVVGGVEALRGNAAAGAITLDLANLNRVIDVDEKSDVAIMQAGLSGPALEAALREKGYTLQHFPQSFEFSTLGGWIATRSAGQASTKYGKIEDMVLGLSMVTPVGSITTKAAPAAANGPSMNQWLIGSEGIFGIITEAQLKVYRIPATQNYRGLLFKTLYDGLAAVRAIAAAQIHPAVLRLSDMEETKLSMALKGKPTSFAESLKQDLGWRYLQRKGYGWGCLMLLGLEGHEKEVAHQCRSALAIARRYDGFDLGRGPGRKWLKSRFELPYLRDDLLDRRVLVDTLETATTWRNVLPLYHALTDTLTQVIGAAGRKALVMAHISHVYSTGASLYFTFACRQCAGAELEQWRQIKQAATDCIMANHGVLSHHHGIGADHAPWLEQEHGPLAMQAMRAVKQTLDPQGIMNPHKLLL